MMQLIPARGRLRIRAWNARYEQKMQLIPARGRLRVGVVDVVQQLQMQLIPARGRLRREHPRGVYVLGCSLSPRGDGY